MIANDKSFTKPSSWIYHKTAQAPHLSLAGCWECSRPFVRWFMGYSEFWYFLTPNYGVFPFRNGEFPGYTGLNCTISYATCPFKVISSSSLNYLGLYIGLYINYI